MTGLYSPHTVGFYREFGKDYGNISSGGNQSDDALPPIETVSADQLAWEKDNYTCVGLVRFSTGYGGVPLTYVYNVTPESAVVTWRNVASGTASNMQARVVALFVRNDCIYRPGEVTTT
jgi:hypothetical protein